MDNQPKVAFVFPGQGSQYAGMGREIAQASPSAAELFAQADEILGVSLSTLCWEGPSATLDETYNTQPALFVTSLACLTALRSAGYTIKPDFVAGHSLGEYAAYVAAGALSFADGLKLVRERGRLMAQAGRQAPGKMAAILKLSGEQVAAICQQVCEQTGWVQIANYNSAEQIIISGEETAIAHAVELAKAAGSRRAMILPVSIAAHSKLMETANAEFKIAVDAVTLSAPAVPVVANITAQPLPTPAEIRAEMLGQLTSSVQWSRSVEFMAAQGVTQFIEIGPKDVLTNLIKRIDKTVSAQAVESIASITALLEAQTL